MYVKAFTVFVAECIGDWRPRNRSWVLQAILADVPAARTAASVSTQAGPQKAEGTPHKRAPF